MELEIFDGKTYINSIKHGKRCSDSSRLDTRIGYWYCTEKKPLPKIVKNRSGRTFLVKIEVSRTHLVILMDSRSKIVKNTNSHSGLVKILISRPALVKF